MDFINIKAIHQKYGTLKLKSYPFLDKKMKHFIKNSGVEFVNFLNWIPYNKDEVKEILKTNLGWRDYGGKHFESIWTRFYQGYILPNKFRIDKRKAHLSSLICSGQITRDESLEELKKPIYDESVLRIDKDFVLKKLGLTIEEFDALMSSPIRDHRDFETEGSFFNYYPVLKPFKPVWEFYKRVTGKI